MLTLPTNCVLLQYVQAGPSTGLCTATSSHHHLSSFFAFDSPSLDSALCPPRVGKNGDDTSQQTVRLSKTRLRESCCRALCVNGRSGRSVCVYVRAKLSSCPVRCAYPDRAYSYHGANNAQIVVAGRGTGPTVAVDRYVCNFSECASFFLNCKNSLRDSFGLAVCVDECDAAKKKRKTKVRRSLFP